MTTPDAGPWAPAGRPDLRTFVPQERRVAPLLVWLGCLAAGLALLLWLGDGRLASPDLTAPSTWGAWASQRGVADVVVAVLRIVALGLAWYLVGVTFVSVLAHAARAARLVRIADALSFGPVRTVVQQALGVGLAVGVVASALPSTAFGGAGAPDAAVVAVRAEGADVAGAPATDRTEGADVAGAAASDRTEGTDGQDGAVTDTHRAAGDRRAAGHGDTAAVAGPPVPAPGIVAQPLEDEARAAALAQVHTRAPGATTGAESGTDDGRAPRDTGEPAAATRGASGTTSGSDDAPGATTGAPGTHTAAGEVASAEDRAPTLTPAAPTTSPTAPDAPTAAGGATASPDAPTTGADGATASPDASTTPPESAAAPGGGSVAPSGDRDAVADAARQVRVRAGDHLWGIAEQDLRVALDREPTEEEVHGHWQRVVAANAERLVVPSNPDLIRPGQLLVLPEVEV